MRVESSAGSAFFLKWNADAPVEMFAAEADGLDALRATGAARVPEPIAHGRGAAGADHGRGDGPAWLLMEFVPPGRADRRADERLGAALAAVHRSGGHGRTVGWRRDNWIGSLPQSNDAAPDWATFWRDRRLAPQLDRARRGGLLTEPLFDRLLDAVPVALAGVPADALLHGDLWSGNVYASDAGEPVLIDPAVYRGHGEVDLAMSELFGGFGDDFYRVYDAEAGVGEAYRAYRRALYQLYYLLVHVNLFGASYVAGSRRAAEAVLAELG